MNRQGIRNGTLDTQFHKILVMLWFQFIALATRETTDRNYPSKNMGGKTMTIVRSEAFAMAGSHQDHPEEGIPAIQD